MRVFVAGATGVIGRTLVPRLLAAGHQVTAMTRDAGRAEAMQTAGAGVAVADAFDAAAVLEAVGSATPDVVINQLTSIPRSLNPRRYGQEMATNDRLRIEGTRHLVQAARASGVQRMIAQSVAFAYAPTGDGLKHEGDPLFDEAPQDFRRTVDALHVLEDDTRGTPGVEGVVLRYGFFYGPGTVFARDGDYARRVRRRQLPIVGTGNGVFSFIHVDDAADATVAALTRGDGIYNVVDDDPAPVREWLPLYAEAIGAKRPFRVPVFVGRLAAGDFVVLSMTELRGASNQRAKEDLGWRPEHPSWRTGFLDALG